MIEEEESYTHNIFRTKSQMKVTKWSIKVSPPLLMYEKTKSMNYTVQTFVWFFLFLVGFFCKWFS